MQDPKLVSLQAYHVSLAHQKYLLGCLRGCTRDHSWSLHKATDHISFQLELQKAKVQKTQKVQSSCLDNPVFAQGGGLLYAQIV